jgi:hypothetical protein
VKDSYHDMGGGSGVLAVLFCQGGPGTTDSLDNKGSEIEGREDNKIPKRLEKSISWSRNTCTVQVSERRLRGYRFPIVTYSPAEKRAGEMMRHVTCMIKYMFNVTS